MKQQVCIRDIAARAARMVLVFALVFWSSFRVECLAFASVFPQTAVPENSTLSDLAVWEVSGDTLKQKARSAVETAQGAEQASAFKVAANGGKLQFVGLPYWLEDDSSAQDEADRQAAQAAEDAIWALPAPEAATVDDEAAAANAQAAFNGLTDAQRAYVSEEAQAHLASVIAAIEAAKAAAEQGGGEGGGESGETGEGGEGEGGGTGEEPGGEEPVVDQPDEPTVEEQSVSTGADDPAAVRPAPVRPAPTAVNPIADDGSATVADFVTWDTIDPSDGTSGAAIAEITWEGGVATLVGKAAGTVTVRCYPNPEAFDYGLVDAGFPGTEFVAQFTVQVMGVSSIEIYRSDTDAETRVDGAQVLELDEDQAKGFGFWAKANVSAGAEGVAETYESSAGRPLSQASDGMFEDLTWSVVDDEGNPVDEKVASITPDGVLTLEKNNQVKVRCSTAQGTAGDYYEEVTVKSGEVKKEVDQGEEHPQDPLTVVVKRSVTTVKHKSGDDDSGEGEPSSETADPDSGEGGSDEDEPAEGGEGAQDENASGAAQDPEGETEENEQTTTISADDFDAIGVNSKTYTMYVGGEAQTVTGRGCTLPMILERAGVSLEEQADIESLEFVNFYDTHTTVAWHDLVSLSHAEASYIVVAKESYVHDPAADEGGSGDEGEQAAQDEASQPAADADQEAIPLLTNTRFRIVFDQSSAGAGIDAGALRWVNTIIVHMKGEVKEAEPEPDKELAVYIDYVPVPKGQIAFLSAVPNSKIGTSNFGYTWSRSTDEGQTWTDLDSDAVQTLRVPTDDEHIGNKYRVKLNTSMKNDEGDDRWAMSEPVTIVEGNPSDFSVKLDYTPPLAGGWANFTSEVNPPESANDPNIEYIWESSTDGGASWTTAGLENEHDKTLRVKTNPVEASDSGSDEGGDAPATLTYIRVTAILGDKKATSNMQLLTVRVGDSDGSDSEDKDGNNTPQTGDPKANDINEQIKNQQPEQPEAPTDPEDITPSEPDDVATEPEDGQQEDEPVIVPIDEPLVESPSHGSIADYMNGEPPEDAPEEWTDPSALLINDDVSKKVKEQKQKEADAKASQRGARWTELSVNASSDDVRRVLAGNPFAPMTAPFALGLTAAGAVEKLFAFRRQIK